VILLNETAFAKEGRMKERKWDVISRDVLVDSGMRLKSGVSLRL
jgi:hypothetical protein